jgi:hypothetical protein
MLLVEENHVGAAVTGAHTDNKIYAVRGGRETPRAWWRT